MSKLPGRCCSQATTTYASVLYRPAAKLLLHFLLTATCTLHQLSATNIERSCQALALAATCHTRSATDQPACRPPLLALEALGHHNMHTHGPAGRAASLGRATATRRSQLECR
jgi:hypothetical protein